MRFALRNKFKVKKTTGKVKPLVDFLFWFSFNAGLFFRKRIFTDAAQGAYEIIGEVLELRAGGNSVIGIAEFLVVFIAAYFANVFHDDPLLYQILMGGKNACLRPPYRYYCNLIAANCQ